MDSEKISNSICELAQSLDMTRAGFVDWNRFLALVATYCGASSGVMKCAIRNDECFGKDTDEQSICLRFDLEHMDSHIGLSFFEREQYDYASNYLNLLKLQIQEIYKLGMLWQEKHQMQKIADSFTQIKRMASVEIDERGTLLSDAGIFSEILSGDALRVINGRLQFSEEPTWLVNVQKNMMLSHDESQTAYRFLSCGDKKYRCVVNYQKDLNEGWVIIKHKFSISFYESNDQSDPIILKTVFSLSRSEAEIASWFSQGLSAEEVANSTGYALSTVYSYIKNLYSNLGINKQSQLTAAVWHELPL